MRKNAFSATDPAARTSRVFAGGVRRQADGKVESVRLVRMVTPGAKGGSTGHGFHHLLQVMEMIPDTFIPAIEPDMGAVATSLSPLTVTL